MRFSLKCSPDGRPIGPLWSLSGGGSLDWKTSEMFSHKPRVAEGHLNWYTSIHGTQSVMSLHESVCPLSLRPGPTPLVGCVAFVIVILSTDGQYLDNASANPYFNTPFMFGFFVFCVHSFQTRVWIFVNTHARARAHAQTSSNKTINAHRLLGVVKNIYLPVY